MSHREFDGSLPGEGEVTNYETFDYQIEMQVSAERWETVDVLGAAEVPQAVEQLKWLRASSPTRNFRLVRTVTFTEVVR